MLFSNYKAAMAFSDSAQYSLLPALGLTPSLNRCQVKDVPPLLYIGPDIGPDLGHPGFPN